MFHSFTSANKVTTKALQVSMTSSLTVGSVYDKYEYHRIATKTYSYVGMDEATARACAAKKEAQYTRDFRLYRDSSWKRVTTNAYEHKCVATVTPTHEEGGLWRVDIQVNEDQVQYVHGDELNLLGSLFVTDFDYDEDTPEGLYMQITSLTLAGSTATGLYESSGTKFDRTSSDFHIEQSASESGPWTDVATTETGDGYWKMSGVGMANYYRLRMGTLTSNVMSSPTHDYTMTGTLGTLVFYSGVCWRAAFSFDVPDFDRSKVAVFIDGTDVTSSCDIRSGTVYFSAKTSETEMFRAKLYYTDGSVWTNESATPYSPTADVGDGTIVPVAATNVASQSGKSVFRLFFDHAAITDYDVANLAVMTSADGYAWEDITTSASLESDGLVIFSGATNLEKYVKLYYNGVQASCGVDTTAYEVTDGLYINGVESSSTISVIYWAPPVADPSLASVTVEASTDGGTTWTELEQTSSSTVSVAVVSGALYEAGVDRLVRVSSGSYVSPSAHIPLDF